MRKTPGLFAESFNVDSAFRLALIGMRALRQWLLTGSIDGSGSVRYVSNRRNIRTNGSTDGVADRGAFEAIISTWFMDEIMFPMRSLFDPQGSPFAFVHQTILRYQRDETSVDNDMPILISIIFIYSNDEKNVGSEVDLSDHLHVVEYRGKDLLDMSEEGNLER